ncbi:hypothetical protein B0H16DRAFT_1460408 [Mycena metata]|uniref:Uncharacterized protein n=1 Tax=Mycena metata TaxID=1033252 RepID=A0AAD7IWA2_9AGAR|nr:hypothetical protein B0H16DRAFT_1460408 [Mycena metata]
MCDTSPKFAFKTRGDPLTFPGCKSLSVGLNRFSHPQITPESIPLPSALTLNRESCSELHHLFSQPFKTPAGSALHLACTFGKFSKLPTQYTPSSHLSLQRVRILLFYDNLDAQCVNAGLYIIYELPPPTLNSERLSELRHLFVQPLKTYASSVLGRIRILAFYDNVGALCIKAGLDIIHEPPPLTLSSERLSELHHLFSQPFKTPAGTSSAHAEQRETLRAPPPLIPAAQDFRGWCIACSTYFWRLGYHPWAFSAHAEQRETQRAPPPLISAAQDFRG